MAAWPLTYSSERFKTRATHIQSCFRNRVFPLAGIFQPQERRRTDEKRDSSGDARILIHPSVFGKRIWLPALERFLDGRNRSDCLHP